MRILLVIHQLLQGGGTETHVMTLAGQLQRRGHQVGIFTSGGLWMNRARGMGVRVHQGKFLPGDLSRVIERFQYQIVHVHDTPGFRLLARTQVPSGRRVVMTIHGMYSDCASIRRSAAKSSRVIAVSPALRSYVIHRCGVPADKVRLIENGVSMGRFKAMPKGAARVRFGIPATAKVVGYAGRFTLDKDKIGRRIVATMAKYARSRRDVWILVAGRGARHALTTSTRCRILGHVDAMQEFYRACDVVVGSGRVAIEALASGVPTISIGTRGYVGPVLASSWSLAVNRNFGDHGTYRTRWTDEQLRADVHRLLNPTVQLKRDLNQMARRVRNRYSDQTMTQRVAATYLGK